MVQPRLLPFDRDTLVPHMTALARRWHEAGDRRHVFLDCYTLMSANMLQAVDEGAFEDGPWVEALLHRFAWYYFDALDRYERGAERAPAVWRVAHDVARQHDAQVLQHLLLGINAHINYDLVLTLLDQLAPGWGALPADARERRYRDHTRVNDIIAATIDTVQDRVLAPASPALELVDRLLGGIDEWLVAELISGWREAVWHRARGCLDAGEPGARARLEAELEADCLAKARRICAAATGER